MKLTAAVVCLWCFVTIEAVHSSCGRDVTTVTTVTTSTCDKTSGKTRTSTSSGANTSSEDDLEAQLVSIKARLDAYDNGFRENRITICGSGVRDYRVKNSQLTVSSKHQNSDTFAYMGRLYYPGAAWTSRTHDQNQWIQVDYEVTKTFYGVVLQGRDNASYQWLTSYRVQYKLNEADSYKFVPDASNAAAIFPGNFDRNTPVVSTFLQPITARFIRLTPLSYHNYMACRFDMLIC